jgi:transcriptional regulator with GAF, ATPase, and Fis domain
MKAVYDLIARAAPSRATVLIQGESGTGKELVARAFHRRSARADRPFITVNSGNLPPDLLESNLFGHVKGAFTGAVYPKKGLFELADKGTIFFDEIGNIPLDTQAKLLRVIQEREFMRLGGVDTIKVDVRIIAATNVSLRAMMQAGSFREDLFYRIHTVPLPIPPLRERPGDIPLLAEHFLETFGARHGKPGRRLSPAVHQRLEAHPWRGNVREMQHVIEMLVLFSEGPEIGEDELPKALRESPRATSPAAPADFASAVEAFERRLLSEAIAAAGGIKAEAARRLGLDANQIKYLCRKHGL